MAVYINLREVEAILQSMPPDLRQYEDESFRSGYDTAVDIATCANENTIWHNTDEVKPYKSIRVLVYFKKDEQMLIARREYVDEAEGWLTDIDDFVEFSTQDTMWAELPDRPEA